MKKVVYSVLLGNYDQIHVFNLQKGFDYRKVTIESIGKADGEE